MRQGDPLSPYLFLIVADVLQQNVKTNNEIRHPADNNLPCPVLQYADDTLIVLRADSDSAGTLKGVLDSFSAATGLAINYNKSTIVPMHCSARQVSALANILACQVGSFPQTYRRPILVCRYLVTSCGSALLPP